MISIFSVTESLRKYLKIHPLLIYYETCIKQLESSGGIKEGGEIREIPRIFYFVEAMRIYLLFHQDQYKIRLVSDIPEGTTYMILRLTNDILYKLVFQLQVIKQYNGSIMALAAGDIKMPDLNVFKKGEDQKNIIYVSILDKKQQQRSEGDYNCSYEILGYLFGFNIFKLLKYQRLDRIIEFINRTHNDEGGYKAFQLLDDYAIKFLQKLPWYERDIYIIHSGTFLQAIGLTWTTDIDFLIVHEHTISEAEKLKDHFGAINSDYDYAILLKDGNWLTKTKPSILRYKKEWFGKQLAVVGGAKDIFDVIANPKHYFIFMGVKIISLKLYFTRVLHRGSPDVYADCVMMEKINHLYLPKTLLCIPNMSIRQGKFRTFDDRTLNDFFYKEIQQRIKRYYHADISEAVIRDKFKRCIVNPFDIYTSTAALDEQDTRLLKQFNKSLRYTMFKKYIKNSYYLLDIGIGRGKDIPLWSKYNIKHVYGIEPSDHSIQIARTAAAAASSSNINLIHSIANIDWLSPPMHAFKFKDLLAHKFDVITYFNTIHYMIRDLELMIQNMKLVMKDNTKIIITCMDGNKIRQELKHKKRIEIKNDQDLIFAIVPWNNYETENTVLVYLKGSNGLDNGSIESLVNIYKLIDVFAKNNIKLVKQINYLDFQEFNYMKNKMTNEQRKVCSYFNFLFFVYKGA